MIVKNNYVAMWRKTVYSAATLAAAAAAVEAKFLREKFKRVAHRNCDRQLKLSEDSGRNLIAFCNFTFKQEFSDLKYCLKQWLCTATSSAAESCGIRT